jgi:inner membrane protein
MDNLCHTLVGAAIGESGLKHRTRFGAATLMIAANLPDVDVLVFATSMPAVAFRRGWTHGPLAQLALPLALTGIMLLLARRFRGHPQTVPIRPGWLFILSLVGALSHVALDLLNSYGLRVLAPFDWRWFYGDALFIIDPWLWIVLSIGIWLARRADLALAARQALIVMMLYIAAMTLNARLARNIILNEWRATRGGEPAALMVGPQPITPFRKHVIVDDGLSYHTASLTLVPRALTWDSTTVPKNDTDSRVARARQDPRVQGFLVWSRFPYWTFEEGADGTRVTVGDMRFAGQAGARFQVSTVVRLRHGAEVAEDTD